MMRWYWFKSIVTDILINRKTHTGTQKYAGRMPCKDRVILEWQVYKPQTQRNAESTRNCREAWDKYPQNFQKEATLPTPLFLDFWPLELWEKKICLLEAPQNQCRSHLRSASLHQAPIWKHHMRDSQWDQPQNCRWAPVNPQNQKPRKRLLFQATRFWGDLLCSIR